MPSTEKITFDQLPQAVTELRQEISGLRNLIDALVSKSPADAADQWMNLDQLREYHPDKPARSTVYEWVCQNRIPVHKDGKKLRFLRSEIDQWLSGGKIKTKEELETEAMNRITAIKRRIFSGQKLCMGSSKMVQSILLLNPGIFLSSNEYLLIVKIYSSKCLLAFLNSKTSE